MGNQNQSIPRRNDLTRNEKSELLIHDAMQAIEQYPADERLTEAVVLLARAKELVADFIDNQ